MRSTRSLRDVTAARASVRGLAQARLDGGVDLDLTGAPNTIPTCDLCLRRQRSSRTLCERTSSAACGPFAEALPQHVHQVDNIVGAFGRRRLFDGVPLGLAPQQLLQSTKPCVSSTRSVGSRP